LNVEHRTSNFERRIGGGGAPARCMSHISRIILAGGWDGAHDEARPTGLELVGRRMQQIWQDIVRFFRGHWAHLLLAIPAVVGFTVVHELAHCAAVWMQGGHVTEFVWLPSSGEWGHIQYKFPPGVIYSGWLVSLAPYFCWLLLCLLTAVLSLKPRPWPFWFASTLFVWCFIVPLADIANAALPYLVWRSDNDFFHAFGAPTLPIAMVLGIGAAVLVCLGFPIQRRLYRERAVGLAAYSVLAAGGAAGIFALTWSG